MYSDSAPTCKNDKLELKQLIQQYNNNNNLQMKFPYKLGLVQWINAMTSKVIVKKP